jgi:heme o synthase
MKTLKPYLEMSKLRIVNMVLVTTTIGYFLGGRGAGGGWGWTFLLTLLGTGMAAAGAACLNNYLERDLDGLMSRTRRRVLPAGTLHPVNALMYGIVMVLSGTTILAWQVNLLSGFLVLLTAFLYVLVYTPMKRWSWVNTSIGAIPGALPPVSGWAAASGTLDWGALALFAILFIWQHPHFYAIAWMCKEDYAQAGFKMLSVVDPTGGRIFRHIIAHSILLLVVATIPTLIGLTGWVYLAGSVLLGLMVLHVGIRLAHTGSLLDARKLLRASVYYLPLLLVLILIDLTKAA